jgi:hypothetical protein
MFMIDPDSLDALLREEWKTPEPVAALEQRVTSAYRSTVRPSAQRTSDFHRVPRNIPLFLKLYR